MSKAYDSAQLRTDLDEDIRVYAGFADQYHHARPLTWRRRLGCLLTPSLAACLLYRLAHLLHVAGWQSTAMAVTRLNQVLTGVSISPASRIGGGLYIPHPASAILFHGHAGRHLCLYSGAAVTAGHRFPMPEHDTPSMPRLGNHVTLGSKAYVVGPALIESGVSVGFNATVEMDLAGNVCVFGPRIHNRVIPRGTHHE